MAHANPRRRKRARSKAREPKEKAFVRSTEARVEEEDVILKLGKGTPGRGGDPGGHYWHVYLGDTRAGRAYINNHVSDEGESYPSITVELNKQSRGRGVGTIAFRQAAELSQYDQVYATVAKKNMASRIALERAGYQPVEGWEGIGLYLVWKRS